MAVWGLGAPTRPPVRAASGRSGRRGMPGSLAAGLTHRERTLCPRDQRPPLPEADVRERPRPRSRPWQRLKRRFSDDSSLRALQSRLQHVARFAAWCWWCWCWCCSAASEPFPLRHRLPRTRTRPRADVAAVNTARAPYEDMSSGLRVSAPFSVLSLARRPAFHMTGHHCGRENAARMAHGSAVAQAGFCRYGLCVCLQPLRCAAAHSMPREKRTREFLLAPPASEW
ncbi:hypothetical protein BU26DRAFT_511839 [Trematosphaeria pertusa]|uniref:Uncharacterized protein n=1 Tax=Trematosphaeria pertusa TaxID=390896 RepID=A0A6A6HUE2_9PLEO|nr:uncharacterized protein BU26DRAFT_511839 [Trematosphaeria pertusa]KAF2241050.1 hypothetical protein BU26DRAFT_511839 [Trematosphaeria pertusa]